MANNGVLELITVFSHAELLGLELTGAYSIVIDVLRGSTTLIHATKNGASKIIPVAEINEALELASKMTETEYLLCGERDGQKIDGFDLGNSPYEYSSDMVLGKDLIYCSTNCSKALIETVQSDRVLIGSFNNLNAVIDSMELEGRIILVCAGKLGRFALEDATCAGMFISQILKRSLSEIAVNDASRTAKSLYDMYHRDLLGMLKESSHGSYLTQLGLDKDLELASMVDIERVVPELALMKTHYFSTVAPADIKRDIKATKFSDKAMSTWRSVSNI
jgi:2-phosphosulfolactate phosphatase